MSSFRRLDFCNFLTILFRPYKLGLRLTDLALDNCRGYGLGLRMAAYVSAPDTMTSLLSLAVRMDYLLECRER